MSCRPPTRPGLPRQAPPQVDGAEYTMAAGVGCRHLIAPSPSEDQRVLRIGRSADAVRHITRRWIPFAERRSLEDMTPGPTAYPAAKVKGDRSMPSKRERSEVSDAPVPQGQRDTVRTGLSEPQPPTMQAYIPRHSVLRRGHRDRAAKSS